MVIIVKIKQLGSHHLQANMPDETEIDDGATFDPSIFYPPRKVVTNKPIQANIPEFRSKCHEVFKTLVDDIGIGSDPDLNRRKLMFQAIYSAEKELLLFKDKIEEAEMAWEKQWVVDNDANFSSCLILED